MTTRPKVRPADPDRTHLVRALIDAAAVSDGHAAVDDADLGFSLAPLMRRELANAVAAACRAETLTVRIGGPVPADPEVLGADSIRSILRIDPLPSFGAPPTGYSCRAAGSLDPERFTDLFVRVFAPQDLGLTGSGALRATAQKLYRGVNVRGRSDYCGRVVLSGERPIGIFFLAGDGPAREIGFLGAVPALRRRFALRGALAAGANWLRERNIAALYAEVELQNSASLAMAARLGAKQVGLSAIYHC